MRIEWLGHAAFLITSEKGVRIITDPYEPGGYGGAVAYEPIKVLESASAEFKKEALPGETKILALKHSH